eukprot:7105426-Prymnesium_polylepis.1
MCVYPSASPHDVNACQGRQVWHSEPRKDDVRRCTHCAFAPAQLEHSEGRGSSIKKHSQMGRLVMWSGTACVVM